MKSFHRRLHQQNARRILLHHRQFHQRAMSAMLGVGLPGLIVVVLGVLRLGRSH